MTANPRVRFAPSPTGLMHVGNARAGLFNYLFARRNGGQLILRIEDTDAQRSTAENVEAIYRDLEWLGITFDGQPVIQSERADRHRELLQRLLDEGKAYHSTATKDDTEAYRARHGNGAGFRGNDDGEGAIRLRIPDDQESTDLRDVVRGRSVFPHAAMDDFVIARADGTPLYNFAVAVDDADAAITHVIRGEDHYSNTPKQMLVMAALGFEAPTYAHLPMLLGDDGKKLAKRHGSASVAELRDAGFLPEAVVNYLALLGYGVEGEEAFQPAWSLKSQFDLQRVSSSPARFDQVKLRWLNGQWVRRLDAMELTARVSDFTGRIDVKLPAAVEAAREKFQTLDEFWPLVGPLFDGPVDDEKAWRKVMAKDGAREALEAARAVLAAIESWDSAAIEHGMLGLPEALDLKPGKLYQPIRVALTGTTVSVGIHDTLALLDQDEALARIDRALARMTTSAVI